MNGLVLAGAGLVALALLFLEWFRPNRRHLFFRLMATAVACVALGFLARLSTAPKQPTTEGALWTASTQVGDRNAMARMPPFALPDATHSAPSDATVIPDAASLRRRFPSLQILHIYGDGLDPTDFPALDGLHVVFHPTEHSSTQVPDVQFLNAPRVLPLGEPLNVSGRIGEVPAGTSLRLSLATPDGDKVETTTSSAAANGEAGFTLRAPALPATGRYVWKLQVGKANYPLGVSVTAPNLPRVLVLEGRPRFDTAALRRWFETAGGMLTVRTQVGKDKFRYAASRGTVAAFTTLNDSVLSDYDLLIVDDRASAALGAEERNALLAAVEKRGMGVLIRADEVVPTPDAPSSASNFAPWKLHPFADPPPAEERSVRPRWSGQSSVPDLPVPTAPFTIDPVPNQEILVDDRQGNPLVVAVRQARGQIALTLVGDTTRWQRANDPAAFAAYWSFIFSRLAASGNGTTRRWSLVNGENGPIFVDHPLELRWMGPPDHRPTNPEVTDTSDATKTAVPLAQPDPREPGTWQTTFWPRHRGWHRIADGTDAATLDFYVNAANDWPALQSTRRRLATERFAALSAAPKPGPPAAAVTRQIPPGGWFAVFLLAVAYLWVERRFAPGVNAHP